MPATTDTAARDIAHHDERIKHAMSRIRVNVALKNYDAIAAWAKDVEEHSRQAAKLQNPKEGV